jgi:hypothetical protein
MLFVKKSAGHPNIPSRPSLLQARPKALAITDHVRIDPFVTFHVHFGFFVFCGFGGFILTFPDKFQ